MSKLAATHFMVSGTTMVAVSPARTSGGTVNAMLISIRELTVVSLWTTWMSVKTSERSAALATPGRKTTSMSATAADSTR